MEKITNNEKIEVLERAIKELSERRASGLCIILRDCLGRAIAYDEIEEYIDLFTFENSRKFSSRVSAKEFGYWFVIDSEGYDERRKFLEWMIQEYKKREKKRKL